MVEFTRSHVGAVVAEHAGLDRMPNVRKCPWGVKNGDSGRIDDRTSADGKKDGGSSVIARRITPPERIEPHIGTYPRRSLASALSAGSSAMLHRDETGDHGAWGACERGIK